MMLVMGYMRIPIELIVLMEADLLRDKQLLIEEFVRQLRMDLNVKE